MSRVSITEDKILETGIKRYKEEVSMQVMMSSDRVMEMLVEIEGVIDRIRGKAE